MFAAPGLEAVFNRPVQIIVVPAPTAAPRREGVSVVTVGTAELRRLLEARPTLPLARVVLTVAGMDAALASAGCGAGFEGLEAQANQMDRPSID